MGPAEPAKLRHLKAEPEALLNRTAVWGRG